MAYFFKLKDGKLLRADRQSDFAETLKSIPNDKIELVIEGVEVNFRFQEVPVVSRPEPTRHRKKKAE